jgi:hypothetical protein
VPLSVIVGLVLLGVGVALLLVGVLAPGAEALTDYGWTVTGAGIGALTGRGADALQNRAT